MAGLKDIYQKNIAAATAEITAKKQRAYEELTKKQRVVQDTPPEVELRDFWVEDGVSLRPVYPFKPFIEIKLLTDIDKGHEDYGENIFKVPYNFVSDFSVNTYPYPKASITLADNQFTWIEKFTIRALALYNETILKRQEGVWEEPFAAPGFARLRWGWEGVTKPITSNWLTMILTGFKYGIRGTWLTISLELIGNSQYFFQITKLGIRRIDKIFPLDKNGNKKDNGTIQEYLETFLKRFNLKNGVHYKLGEGFDHQFAVDTFHGYINSFLKSDTSLMTFINETLKLQILHDSGTKEQGITTIETSVAKPDKEEDFEKYGLIKKWELKQPLNKRGSNAAGDFIKRVYEWRDTPTSVVQSLEAQIPEGYFLGFASLSFLGVTLDDNGNVAEQIVRFDNGNVKALSTLKDQVKTLHDKEVQLKHRESDPKISEKLKQAQKTLSKQEVGYGGLNKKMTTFLKKYGKKDKKGNLIKKDGNWTLVEQENDTITVTDPETGQKTTRPKTYSDIREEFNKIAKDRQDGINKVASVNAQIGTDQEAAKKSINRTYDDYIKNHSEFKPIPTIPQGTDGEGLQDRAARDEFILGRLMTTINEDMVLRLNLTVLGDPYLDGVHIPFETSRVRVIVNRPDGKPSLLTNYYLFLPTGVTHSINRSGYSTSMTLITAREEQTEQLRVSLASAEEES